MKPLPTPRAQTGASLIIALIFLVILTLLGVAVSNVTSLEERMAGNTRDRDLAFQAAEAALQDAEQRLTDSAFRALVTKTIDASNATDANDAAYWNAYDWANDSIAVSKTIEQVAAQPLMTLERYGTTNTYRVTARGVGATTNSVVFLQAQFIYHP